MGKVGKAIEKGVKKVGEIAVQPLESMWHLGEAAVNVVQGDWSGATENLQKAAGDTVYGLTGSKKLGHVAEAATGYGLLNFNKGSGALERATGWDIDNSKAEAAEAAAQAEYQRQVDEANAAAQRNRRASLLNMRKSLTPSTSKATQGGAASGTQNANTGTGGIILG